MILLGLTLYLFMLTLYFTLTLDVKNVSYGCLNVEIRTASSLPILIDFFDFLPKLCSLVRNTFMPIFRGISHGIETTYKVAKICLKLMKIKSEKYSKLKIFYTVFSTHFCTRNSLNNTRMRFVQVQTNISNSFPTNL